MGLQMLTERRSERIAGVLSCYDRIVVQGTLPGPCYAEGMTGYLYAITSASSTTPSGHSRPELTLLFGRVRDHLSVYAPEEVPFRVAAV